MGLDLLPGGVDVLREAGDLEDGLLVARGRHDVGVRLLLDALDGRALRTHDQAHHAVRHADLQGDAVNDIERAYLEKLSRMLEIVYRVTICP